jgi:hypothetical protein
MAFANQSAVADMAAEASAGGTWERTATPTVKERAAALNHATAAAATAAAAAAAAAVQAKPRARREEVVRVPPTSPQLAQFHCCKGFCVSTEVCALPQSTGAAPTG